MTHDPTYIYSQRSAASVGHLLAVHYALATPVHCRFYVLGLHDNYLVKSAGRQYMFRIYRNDWRTPEEALFELELLSHLNDRGAPVAGPVPTVTKELAIRIASPEGERMAALFHYAEGHAPADAITPDECVLLGHAVARVHDIAETFETTHVRRELDVRYLIDESIVALEPFLNRDARAFIGDCQHELHALLPGLQKAAGVYGICTGDVNPGNCHISRGKHITLFDFDQCGYGYRAFEIGKFASSIHSHPLKHPLVEAFMRGYRQVRAISEAEQRVIPYFEMAAVIWVMAINARNADRIGYKFLDQPFWAKKLAVLKALHARQQDRQGRV